MKPFEKIKIFKDAVVSAYKEMNADRDLAESLLETAIQIQDKYKLLAELCKVTAEGITQIRDMFSKDREAPDKFALQKTLREASNVIGHLFTAVKSYNPDMVTFVPIYDEFKGHAYSGMTDMFNHLASDIQVHIDLMRMKIRGRNFRGAIRQYAAMTELVKSRCMDLGLEIPVFSKLNLDKYKNTEENDN